jgi:hypothetical protein
LLAFGQQWYYYIVSLSMRGRDGRRESVCCTIRLRFTSAAHRVGRWMTSKSSGPSPQTLFSGINQINCVNSKRVFDSMGLGGCGVMRVDLHSTNRQFGF